LKFIDVHTKADFSRFYKLGSDLYNDNPYYRSSEDDIMRLIVEGPSHFYSHAIVSPIIVFHNDEPVSRFAYVLDNRLPEYVQVAFFEAKQGQKDLVARIIAEAKKRFPKKLKICFGLNGHLNYGAGILLNNFQKIPVFGLPYTLEYYKEYFVKLDARKIVSFRFPAEITERYNKLSQRMKSNERITIKKLDKSNLEEYSKVYTELNNTCFTEHPFWAKRDTQEDLELFDSFKYLLKDDHLIFAEYDGKPIGFLLWFPDFNQLLKKNRELKANSKMSLDVIRSKYFNSIDTFRFTEIAVHSSFRKKGVEMALINQMIDDVVSSGYKYGVGGFIFEENFDSINMAIKYIERITGNKVEPDSEYAVFETNL